MAVTTRNGRRRAHGELFDRSRFVALVAGAALFSGYLIVSDRTALAVAFVLVPVGGYILGRPGFLVGALGASVPFFQSVTGNAGPVHVAVSDVLIAGIATAAVLEFYVGSVERLGEGLRFVKQPLVQYGAFMILLLPFHLGLEAVIQTGQRFELFLLPALVGAYAVAKGHQVLLLRAYIVAATVLAAVWPVNDLGLQKNPAGQMMTNAVLLIVALPAVRALAPCALVLLPGLLLTQSRGAIFAAILGFVVITLVRGSVTRRTMIQVTAASVVGVVAFFALPGSYQTRITTVTPGQNSPAQYALKVRQTYKSDAEKVIAQHPIVGVGVGNYLAGNTSDETLATDPHNVLLLEAAEGGYGFLVSFVLLIVGVAHVLVRLRRLEIAVAAAAIFIATAAHGLVDVYWVRGTPVLPWLLVGMAVQVAAQRQGRS